LWHKFFSIFLVVSDGKNTDVFQRKLLFWNGTKLKNERSLQFTYETNVNWAQVEIENEKKLEENYSASKFPVRFGSLKVELRKLFIKTASQLKWKNLIIEVLKPKQFCNNFFSDNCPNFLTERFNSSSLTIQICSNTRIRIRGLWKFQINDKVFELTVNKFKKCLQFSTNVQ